MTLLGQMRHARLGSILLPLALCGCVTGYTSRIELPAAEAARADTVHSIQEAVGIALVSRDFHAVAEKDYMPVSPGLVTEWRTTKERGFWLGGCTVNVTLSLERDLVVIAINCTDTASRKEVREIQDVLKKTIGAAFPRAKIRVMAGYDVTAMPP
jgi:hypothetical protein